MLGDLNSAAALTSAVLMPISARRNLARPWQRGTVLHRIHCQFFRRGPGQRKVSNPKEVPIACLSSWPRFTAKSARIAWRTCLADVESPRRSSTWRRHFGLFAASRQDGASARKETFPEHRVTTGSLSGPEMECVHISVVWARRIMAIRQGWNRVMIVKESRSPKQQPVETGVIVA